MSAHQFRVGVEWQRQGHTHQDLREVVVRNISELRAVELGDDKLHRQVVRPRSTSPPRIRERQFTNRMTLAKGVDVKEGQGLIALEELQRRNLPYGG